MTTARTSASNGRIAQGAILARTSRARTSRAKSAAADKPSSATVDDNALPDRIRRKYYVVANETGKDGPDGEARFTLTSGASISPSRSPKIVWSRVWRAAEVIRDMVSVAQHRQWEALHVRGSAEFRREAWLEAGARGIEVQGYQPTELDRQALSDRQEVWNRSHPRTHEVRFVRFLTGTSARKDLTTTKVSQDA